VTVAQPRPRTRALVADLVASGRERRCEVVGCCQRPDTLQVHHVMPRAVAVCSSAHSEHMPFADAVSNLVFLCADHHALVERAYFYAVCGLRPELAVLYSRIQALARDFDRKAVPPQELEAAQVLSSALREDLERLVPWNALWWQTAYARAARWASHQQILRAVHPSRALIEAPWFRDRRGPHFFSESETVHDHAQ
jgi:hypothetical protein